VKRAAATAGARVPPRDTPKGSPKAEETRRRILGAALDLFQERGFGETTMRDIAGRAGVATGAAYYYFASKEQLVFAFYAETQEEIEGLVEGPLAASRDFRARVRAVLTLKLEQFRPHRSFLGALFRTAADPESPLSPFGESTAEIRDRAVALFDRALTGSDLKVAADLRPHLPRLLWLYQMGLILFFIHDRSPGQRRTWQLLDKSLDILVGALRISRFRVMAPVRRSALDLLAFLDDAEGRG